MDGFSILNTRAWDSTALTDQPEYHIGNALGWLHRGDKQASTNHVLVGRLYLAKSGWLLLSVPNALVRGVYDAMSAPGAELPLAGVMNVPNVGSEVLNAHISVMTADEVKKVGVDNINERGHMFGYSLGHLKEITPRNIDGISKVWALQVSAPALSAIRKSYGLDPLLNGHQFHITVAVRRKSVLRENTVSKAAADENPQPRVRVVMPYKNQYLLETLTNPKWPANLGKRRFIGGGVEAGETPEQAAARELFEELGVKVKPTDFRLLGNDPNKTHEHYLELAKHKIKPGVFKSTVGSDPYITLSRGLPAGDDYMGPDIKKLLAPALAKTSAAENKHSNALSRSGQKDLLPGGEADNLPDRDFSPPALAEGAKHEHEHTNNDQVAKEIAKDHLQENPAYYEKIKQIEKTAASTLIKELREAKEHSDNKRYDQKTQILRRLMVQSPQDWRIDDPKPRHKGITHEPTSFKFHVEPTAIPPSVKAALVQMKTAAPRAKSVYANQLYNSYSLHRPVRYDFNKSLFDNVADHARDVKSRGDFKLQADRNYKSYMATRDPNYRYQLALKAMNNELEEPAVADQIISRYGDSFLNAALGLPK